MQNGNYSSAKWPEGTCKDIYHRQDVVCGHTVASTDFMGDDDILWFLSVGSNDGTVIWIWKLQRFRVLVARKVSAPPQRQEWRRTSNRVGTDDSSSGHFFFFFSRELSLWWGRRKRVLTTRLTFASRKSLASCLLTPSRLPLPPPPLPQRRLIDGVKTFPCCSSSPSRLSAPGQTVGRPWASASNIIDPHPYLSSSPRSTQDVRPLSVCWVAATDILCLYTGYLAPFSVFLFELVFSCFSKASVSNKKYHHLLPPWVICICVRVSTEAWIQKVPHWFVSHKWELSWQQEKAIQKQTQQKQPKINATGR